MRRLIVNADDFGIHPARNRGVAEAVRAGVVTSVSLIANLEGFDDAIALLRTMPPVDVGLHLNLSEGRPLGASYATLVGEDGRFPGKLETRRRALEGRLAVGEIEAEIEAQIARLRAAGVEPTHVDGHQHVHVYGLVVEAVARAGRRHGVGWTRLPSEPTEPSARLPEERLEQIAEYRGHAERSRTAMAAQGLCAADHFRGLALSGRMTPEGLAALVRGLPEGTTELMVHPGRCRDWQGQLAVGSGFDCADREAELTALLSPAFRRALDEAGVELVRRGQVA